MNQCHWTHKKNLNIGGKVLIDACLPEDGVRLWTLAKIEAIQRVVGGGDVGNPWLGKLAPRMEEDLPWNSLNACAGDLKNHQH